MTRYQPGPHDPPVPQQGQPIPEDPYPNKAIAAAVTTLLAVAIQWLTSETFTFEQEGVTAIAGAVTTVLVYVLSNWKRRGL
jgi:hypothetical protein